MRTRVNMLPEPLRGYATLALKAQAQSRLTLEALAEIKNPRPVAFVKEANTAQGPPDSIVTVH